MKCTLPSCGREVSEEQLRAWRETLKRRPRKKGHYCSAECYHDSGKAARK